MSLELKWLLTFLTLWAIGRVIGHGEKQGSNWWWTCGIVAAIGMLGFFTCAFLWIWK